MHFKNHLIAACFGDVQQIPGAHALLGAQLCQIELCLFFYFLACDQISCHRVLCRIVNFFTYIKFPITETVHHRRTHQKMTDILCISDQLSSCEPSICQALHRVVICRVRSRIRNNHVNVVLGAHHRNRIALGAFLAFLVHLRPPVGHYHALVAPVFPQNRRQQVVVACCPDSVDRSVGRHNAVGMSFFYCDFKAL